MAMLIVATGWPALREGLPPPGAPRPTREGGGGGDTHDLGAPEGQGPATAKPTEIPPAGWWELAKRVYAGIEDDRVLAVAAGVTFYALLALFPAVASLVSLYGLFADPLTISQQLNSLSGVLPGGAVEIIGEQVKRIAAQPHGSLSFTLLFSLAVSLWSANAGVKAVFDALNVVYEEKERRSFIKLNLVSLAFTAGGIVILLLVMGAVVAVPVILKTVGLGGITETLLALARWPLMLLVILLALAVLYRFGPSRAAPKWRWITWGSAFAAVSWLIASALFSFYVSHFGSYNATYGSLGAAIGFMTWMWISATVVLVGGEITAQIERQAAKEAGTA